MNVMPQAMMPLKDTASSTFKRLRCVMKLGANTASATKRMITANNSPVRDRSELSRENSGI